MAKEEEQEKKIIIDDDWKAEAQKEKEDLAAKTEVEKEEKATEKERPPLPEANFSGLVSMLATQAFFAMGVLRPEEYKDQPADMEMAKFNIDMIGVIEEKTKGNLSKEEGDFLSNTLQQLRMTFVKLSESDG